MGRFSFLSAFFLFFISSAVADPVVIARCGASSGQAFYFEGGIVPPGQGGWRKDGIEGGQIVFLLDEKGVDIVFHDTTGTRSHRAEGSNVRVVAAEKDIGSYIFVAENKTSIEHYLLKMNSAGVGTLIWGTVATSALRTKSSIFRSECG